MFTFQNKFSLTFENEVKIHCKEYSNMYKEKTGFFSCTRFDYGSQQSFTKLSENSATSGNSLCKEDMLSLFSKCVLILFDKLLLTLFLLILFTFP